MNDSPIYKWSISEFLDYKNSNDSITNEQIEKDSNILHQIEQLDTFFKQYAIVENINIAYKDPDLMMIDDFLNYRENCYMELRTHLISYIKNKIHDLRIFQIINIHDTNKLIDKSTIKLIDIGKT